MQALNKILLNSANQLEVSPEPEEILRTKQLEVLKSLVLLMVKEVESLNEEQLIVNNKLHKQNISFYEEVRRFEISMIRNALILSGGVQRKAAFTLGLKVSTLNEKIRRYRIDLANYEKA